MLPSCKKKAIIRNTKQCRVILNAKSISNIYGWHSINRSLFIFWNIYIYHEFYVIWFLLDYMWGPRMKVMWQMYSWKGKVLVYVMRYIRLCGMCYYIIHWYYSKSVWVIHTVWLQNMPYNQRKLLLPCDFISPLLYENCMCNTFSILKELLRISRDSRILKFNVWNI